MTTVGMQYDVIPGKEKEFENGFFAIVEHLHKVPGHIESKLFQDVSSPGSYLILSQWQTREAFDAFLRSPEFRSTTSWGKAEILRARPKHKVYQDA
jgi:heme-degrading monooxygenase HmoA